MSTSKSPAATIPARARCWSSAQQKYGKLVQMGTQQRSSPHTIEIVNKIHTGLIGRAYFAKAWYNNTRKSIGIGKDVPVPPHARLGSVAGPAPRQPYKDNVQPYNWHWFRIWGTGETLNNGTHEVDVCRWALGVDYPNRVTASGGRYAFKDDWQFYDTLITSFEYDDKMISLGGRVLQRDAVLQSRPRIADRRHRRHRAGRSRRLRGLRPEGQEDRRIQGAATQTSTADLDRRATP